MGQRLARFKGIPGNMKKHIYHNDHLGSTRAITDEDGTIVASVDYYPFGDVLSQTGDSHLKYNGKELDEGYGFDLYYYGARYYSSGLGRFISPDPVKDFINPYSYVSNNPMNRIDPTGMAQVPEDPQLIGIPAIPLGMTINPPTVSECWFNALRDAALMEHQNQKENIAKLKERLKDMGLKTAADRLDEFFDTDNFLFVVQHDRWERLGSAPMGIVQQGDSHVLLINTSLLKGSVDDYSSKSVWGVEIFDEIKPGMEDAFMGHLAHEMDHSVYITDHNNVNLIENPDHWATSEHDALTTSFRYFDRYPCKGDESWRSYRRKYNDIETSVFYKMKDSYRGREIDLWRIYYFGR